VSVLPLDSRQARIARLLLDTSALTSVERLAVELNLTNRIVRYNLASVEAHLAEHGVRIARRRGVGIWVEGGEEERSQVRAGLDTSPGPDVLDVADRHSSILLALLEAAPDAIRSEALERLLGVSRPTVRRDVRIGEAWLEAHRLHLRRLPGIGLAVRGSEVEVRAALLALVLEFVPGNVLATKAGAPGSRSGCG